MGRHPCLDDKFVPPGLELILLQAQHPDRTWNDDALQVAGSILQEAVESDPAQVRVFLPPLHPPFVPGTLSHSHLSSDTDAHPGYLGTRMGGLLDARTSPC